MDSGDLLKSGLGAVIGFGLAQMVNLVKLGWDSFKRPRLLIDASHSNCLILSHSNREENGEMYEEEIYGFYVRNSGRRVATGVKFQLLKIEYRGASWPEFAVASDRSFDLATYKHVGSARGDKETTLVPGAAALVALATWREDSDVVFPLVTGLPDYYQEICEGSAEFRFTVVAIDDKARFVTGVMTVLSKTHARRSRPRPELADTSAAAG